MARRSFPLAVRPWAILAMLWLLAVGVDGVWLWLDQSVPSWDLANHLTGALNHWWAVSHAQWGSGQWWHELWSLSSKYPPLVYIATAPVMALLGTAPDQATLVNGLFSGLLLVAVYQLGRHCFGTATGLWAAALCLLFPRFYRIRTLYLIDYPLTALVVTSLWCLTVWKDAKTRLRQWLWAIALGVALGLVLMTKQTAVIFLLPPLLMLLVSQIGQRQWGRVVQLISSGGLAIAITLPWLTTNWLFQISVWASGNLDAASSEGDPPLHTLAAWLYYWNDLPRALSFPLLIVPLVGLLLSALGRLKGDRPSDADSTADGPDPAAQLRWLALILGSAYLLLSGIYNKDPRYIMPLYGLLAVVLGYGLTRWGDRWRPVRGLTVGLAAVLLVLNLFPVGGPFGQRIAQVLSPQGQHPPLRQGEFPHAAVIDEIIRATPYQRVNLGVLHANATLNENNFNYFGNRRNFQVYGRRLGNSDRFLEDDLNALSWFVTRLDKVPGESGKVRRQRATLLQIAEDSNQFQHYRTWTLPDEGRLHLFRRHPDYVTIRPVQPPPPSPPDTVRLVRVRLPDSVPPEGSIPVTYEWVGSWQALNDGLVLLTWHPQGTPPAPQSWIHDHAIGLGTLHPGPIQAGQTLMAAPTVTDPARVFRVIERLAMRPPDALAPGRYTLEATYLNRKTGETYPLQPPDMALTVAPNAPAIAAPPLDYVSRLRDLAHQLPQGLPALDTIFDQVGRINLYDPIQSYLGQAEDSLAYRLQQAPTHRDYAYGLALARVLQQDADGAIAALEQVVTLDSQNPYAYAYLAFVHLYLFQPHAAEQSLRVARTLAPDSPEIQGLSAIAALMGGNLWQAWQYGQPLIGQQAMTPLSYRTLASSGSTP